MAQWAVTIGHLDISFAVSLLSRFSAAPREHHLELAYYLFGYHKKYPNRRIVVDSQSLLVDQELLSESFPPDFLEDYQDAAEDVASNFPTPFGCELETSVFFMRITLTTTRRDATVYFWSPRFCGQHPGFMAQQTPGVYCD